MLQGAQSQITSTGKPKPPSPKNQPNFKVQQQIVDEPMQIDDEHDDSDYLSDKEPLMEHEDPDYVAVLTTEFLKKQLRSQGPYGHNLEAAKRVYDFHQDQARILKKAMKRAVASLEQDLLESQDEDNEIKPYIVKNRKLKRRDENMNMQ